MIFKTIGFILSCIKLLNSPGSRTSFLAINIIHTHGTAPRTLLFLVEQCTFFQQLCYTQEAVGKTMTKEKNVFHLPTLPYFGSNLTLTFFLFSHSLSKSPTGYLQFHITMIDLFCLLKNPHSTLSPSFRFEADYLNFLFLSGM